METINTKNKVLIVDDRPENLIALEAILEELDLKIIKANSGNEALGFMLENDFAMVLLDVQMPGMDGFEVAELMKSNDRTKFIPIIFITAISNEDRYQFKAYHVGAVDFILKPIVPEILVSKVKVFIQLYEQKEKIRRQAIALESANDKLRNLSFLDGLTQIPNRRKLDYYLENMWKTASIGTDKLSIILLDIDYFKRYNDYYGHIKGDECLNDVAKSLERTVEQTGYFLSRYGGEEFIVVMPNVFAHEAELFAKELCTNIQELKLDHHQSPIDSYVTISAGVATSIIDEQVTSNSLINHADEALYRAKASGRSRVVVYK